MIREAIENDLTDILEIYNDAILNTTSVYDYKPHTINDREQWYEKKRQDGYPILVYEENNKVVGLQHLDHLEHGQHINTLLSTLFILIKYVEIKV